MLPVPSTMEFFSGLISSVLESDPYGYHQSALGLTSGEDMTLYCIKGKQGGSSVQLLVLLGSR